MAIPVNNNLAQPAQSQDKQKKTGSGFTNLQRVMQANVGNRLGSTIGRNIQQVGQNVQKKAGESQQKFGQVMGQIGGTIKTAGEVASGLQKPIQSSLPPVQPSSGGNQMMKTSVSPEVGAREANIRPGSAPILDTQNIQNLASQQNIEAAKALREGYQGPLGLEGSENLRLQAQQASRMGSQIGSEAGRQALMKKFAGGDQYTAGQQRLDAMLLGGQSDKLRQGKREVRGLAGKVEGLAGAAESEAQAAKEQFSRLRSEIDRGTLAQKEALEKGLDQRIQERVGLSQQALDSLKGRLKAGELSQEDISTLEQAGIDPNMNIYEMSGEDIGNRLSANLDFSRSGVMSQDELAARNALAQLAGKSGQEFMQVDEGLLGRDTIGRTRADVGAIKGSAEELGKRSTEALDKGKAELAQIQEARKKVGDFSGLDPINSVQSMLRSGTFKDKDGNPILDINQLSTSQMDQIYKSLGGDESIRTQIGQEERYGRDFVENLTRQDAFLSPITQNQRGEYVQMVNNLPRTFTEDEARKAMAQQQAWSMRKALEQARAQEAKQKELDQIQSGRFRTLKDLMRK